MQVMSLMTWFSELFQENGQLVALWSTLTAVVGGVAIYIVKNVIPKALNLVVTWVVKVTTKMFGGEVEGVDAAVKELPIVQKMESYSKEIQTTNEIKLIELKNKLVSPKISSIERIAYQAVYDKLIKELGTSISPETVAALAAIDMAAKERTV